ncbi:LIM domain kinase 2 [Cytospora mali]|uniref:LIM domain kinase 2 n=1 Tax=Cytospora mali TaxID=578113 RepID=A0A194VPI7_CYTMA|nr:LIM domain kinase 2 [Valsa mali]
MSKASDLNINSITIYAVTSFPQLSKICETGEAFVEKGGDFVFDHTKIILQEDDQFFYAKTDKRILGASPFNIDNLHPIKIPDDRLWPPADPGFTRAPDPLPSSSYFKRPRLLNYDDSTFHLQILNEVKVCEVLRRHPHPNIAHYLGCVIKDNLIHGLGFARYPISLSQLLRDGVPFDRDECLRGIEAGMKHMHGLGLIHNDLNPSNVMMDGDHAVIIDFDSCKQEGQELGDKAGTYGWSLDDEVYAKRENDLYSFSRIQAALNVPKVGIVD